MIGFATCAGIGLLLSFMVRSEWNRSHAVSRAAEPASSARRRSTPQPPKLTPRPAHAC